MGTVYMDRTGSGKMYGGGGGESKRCSMQGACEEILSYESYARGREQSRGKCTKNRTTHTEAISEGKDIASRYVERWPHGHSVRRDGEINGSASTIDSHCYKITFIASSPNACSPS